MTSKIEYGRLLRVVSNNKNLLLIIPFYFTHYQYKKAINIIGYIYYDFNREIVTYIKMYYSIYNSKLRY